MHKPNLLRRTRRLHVRDEVGGSAVEYGILISAVVLVIIAGITLFGLQVSELYANVF
ncbi:Flp family type IVb pilin [Nocardioides humilatus]|uniref:Flp family type IVb pilin n=1 Tax=Nocardioides humilatus TaxID=2607660 RepID=A0A5B1LCG9_9ACTN|nr:Flp family type IVb pilin [Nocardioides humilatus]KAA1417974.1 Flp family type IVb pilin [Nocardioides humilatus]